MCPINDEGAQKANSNSAIQQSISSLMLLFAVSILPLKNGFFFILSSNLDFPFLPFNLRSLWDRLNWAGKAVVWLAGVWDIDVGQFLNAQVVKINKT